MVVSRFCIHKCGFKIQRKSRWKYLDHSSFKFDHAFDETVPFDEVYLYAAMPLIDFVCNGMGGRATVFPNGQTGSGRTFTIQGTQEHVSEDLFTTLQSGDYACTDENTTVAVASFEIYEGYIQDLLNDRKKLKVL